MRHWDQHTHLDTTQLDAGKDHHSECAFRVSVTGLNIRKHRLHCIGQTEFGYKEVLFLARAKHLLEL